VGVKSVGVTGGTSTLKESIHAVYERLKGIAVEMEEKVAMNEIFQETRKH
jgi:4-hydroxy-3-methylbut-2-enyl diphosphate reductase IspH